MPPPPLPKHRLTGIRNAGEELDCTPFIPPYDNTYSEWMIERTPKPFTAEFTVTGGDDKTGIYYISQLADGDSGQNLEVFAESFTAIDTMDKCKGAILQLALQRKYRIETNASTGTTIYAPYFAVVKAHMDEPGKVTTVPVRDMSNKLASKEVVYDKYCKIALQKIYRLAADRTACDLVLKLHEKSAAEMAELVGIGIPPADPKSVETFIGENLKSSNLFRAAQEGGLVKDPAAFEDELINAYKDRLGTHPKTFAELAKGELADGAGNPIGISYRHDADGKPLVDKTTGAPLPPVITSALGSNMCFDDDKQDFPKEVMEALTTNNHPQSKEILISYMVNRLAMRRISNEVSKYQVLDPNDPTDSKKARSMIIAENEKLRDLGILFDPLKPKDPIIPGLKKDEAAALSAENLQLTLDRALTRQFERSGAAVFCKNILEDDVCKKMEEWSDRSVNSMTAIEAMELRMKYIDTVAGPMACDELKEAVNSLRNSMGLPKIGENPPLDAKAIWAGILEGIAHIGKLVPDFHGEETNFFS